MGYTQQGPGGPLLCSSKQPRPQPRGYTMTETTRLGPANSDDIIRRGQEAFSRLKAGRSREDWLAVAEAIQEGRRIAMIQANTNQPRGSLYGSIFGEWLRQTGFDAIGEGERKRLLDCLTHRVEIEAWLETVPANKRLTLNHPNSIWRNWQKTTVAGKATKDTEKLSPVARLKQSIATLEEENDHLRRAGDDLFSARDSAADIARLLADRLLQRLSADKARQVIGLLPDVIAERAELSRDLMKPPKQSRKHRRTVEDFRRDLTAKRTEIIQP